MKIFKKLFVLLLLLSFIIPFGVSAEENDTKEKVTIYFFRGEGCHYCEDALTWLAQNRSKYEKYYNLVTFEVWNNQDNATLMKNVADSMGDEAGGVPYIILGNYSYPNGFAADTQIDESGKTMGEDFIEKLMSSYENQEKNEKVDEIVNNFEAKVEDKDILSRFASTSTSEKSKKSNPAVGVVSVLVIITILATTLYMRKNN